jgi:hypothetical protein
MYESVLVSACADELFMLQHSEVSSQRKLNASLSLLSALDLCTEAVEVLDSHFSVEVPFSTCATC